MIIFLTWLKKVQVIADITRLNDAWVRGRDFGWRTEDVVEFKRLALGFQHWRWIERYIQNSAQERPTRGFYDEWYKARFVKRVRRICILQEDGDWALYKGAAKGFLNHRASDLLSYLEDSHLTKNGKIVMAWYRRMERQS